MSMVIVVICCIGILFLINVQSVSQMKGLMTTEDLQLQWKDFEYKGVEEIDKQINEYIRDIKYLDADLDEIIYKRNKRLEIATAVRIWIELLLASYMSWTKGNEVGAVFFVSVLTAGILILFVALVGKEE